MEWISYSSCFAIAVWELVHFEAGLMVLMVWELIYLEVGLLLVWELIHLVVGLLLLVDRIHFVARLLLLLVWELIPSEAVESLVLLIVCFLKRLDILRTIEVCLQKS
jgi:hypothetical protein